MIRTRKILAAVLSAAVAFGTLTVPSAVVAGADETVIYETDFSGYSKEPSESGQYPDKSWGMGAWYDWMNNKDNIEWSFGTENGVSGRDEDDTSLMLRNVYKKPYGTFTFASGAVCDDFARNVMISPSNGGGNLGGKNFLHVSFSVSQSIMRKKWTGSEKGSGLKTEMYFNGGASSKTVLSWYAPKKMGGMGTFFDYQVTDGQWMNFDYVFEAASGKVSIYVNGYKVLSDYSSGVKNIKGISQLRFLLTDVDNSESVRDSKIYLDDIKIAASDAAPRISPVSSLGDRARLDAPELSKYVNHDAGVIYNYGQKFSDMKQYIGYDSKLIAEELGSTAPGSSSNWPMVSDYDSDSLDARKLNDGRTVSPTVYIYGDYSPFCYAVRQPVSTRMTAEIADIETNAVRVAWNGAAEDSAYVEIFRDGEFVGRADSAEGSFLDAGLLKNTAYEYTLREIKTDDNATLFTSPIKTFIANVGRPEDFAVESVPNRVAIRVSWSAPKYGTATGYELYRNGELYRTFDADVTEFVDEEGLVTGTTYAYSIAAVDGEEKSDRTAEKSALAAIILAPKNVAAAEESGKIRITWDAVEDAAAYEVYVSGEKAAETDECSYLFEGETDTLYRFTVKAQNKDGFLSEDSAEKFCMITNPALESVYQIFTDSLGSEVVLNTDGAEAEASDIYACLGRSGVGITFAPTVNDARAAGFKRSANFNLGTLKNTNAEIRFLINVPEGADTKNLSLGVAQSYTSKVAGSSVVLRAAVSLDKYLSGSGWQLVRVPLKDLPANGSYKAAYMPYEAEFDYSKTEEIDIISEMQGMAESAVIMVDEVSVLAGNAPAVEYAAVGGAEITDGMTLSGKTREIEIKFTDKMDSSTVSSLSITLLKGETAIPLVTEYDEKNGVYKVSLLENPEAETEYTLRIEKAVSANGMPMTTAFERKFVTDGETNSDAPTKSFDMGKKTASGKKGSVVTYELDVPETLKGEKIGGLNIKITYNEKLLKTVIGDVRLNKQLTAGGVKAAVKDGTVTISRADDSENPIDLSGGIGKVLFEVLAAGTSDVKIDGTVTLICGETTKEIGIGGSMTVTGSGSSSTGGSGGGSAGGGSTGGGRPSGGTTGGSTGGNTGGIAVKPSDSGLSDIAGVDWAREAIEYLYKNKIISGYEDNTFRPDASITREEFAAIAVRAFGLLKDNAAAGFTDAASNEWYYPFIASAAECGMINGKDDGSFGVGETITRQDMCAILARIVEIKGAKLGEKYAKLEFADGAEISDYAAAAVAALQQAGVINGTGDNMFTPRGAVSRAMAAKAVYGMLGAVNSLGGTTNEAN